MNPGPRREVRLGGRDVERTNRPDGTTLVVNREPLAPYARAIPEFLVRYAAEAPERTFLAERTADGSAWRTVTYREALATVRAIGQALLNRGLSQARGIAILSENSVDHALLGLGAQYAGVVHAPVSPAYSLLATDFTKLRAVVDIVAPGLIYASSATRYARALESLHAPSREIVTSLDALRATVPAAGVDAAYAALGPETIGKILFSSGSTGSPKGVINTQRMMCSNVQMARQVLPFLTEEPPVVVDWLPWSHTFGGNHNVNQILANGGTLYVNGGRPTPDGIAETVRNVCEVRPTIHYDVPKGFEMLLDALRTEDAKRRAFFARIKMLMYAGAGLAQHVWDGLIELSLATAGERIFTTTSLGSTETAPLATAAPWWQDAVGNIGIPVPGVTMKLVPSGGKREVRFAGPSITPGYLGAPERTRAAFDEEGFYRIGDALRFADERDAAQGFFFDGRISEDFKLATGTWVNYGPLRARVIAHFAPLLTDVVLTGENRDELGAIAFPDPAQMQALGPDGLRAALAGKLATFAATATGSSTLLARLAIAAEPPSLARGEATDKGSLNARAVVTERAALVEQIHAPQPPPSVIVAKERVR